MTGRNISRKGGKRKKEMNTNKTIIEAYEDDKDFRTYADKYCKTYGYSADEALSHELVRQVYLQYAQGNNGSEIINTAYNE